MRYILVVHVKAGGQCKIKNIGDSKVKETHTMQCTTSSFKHPTIDSSCINSISATSIK